MKPKRFEILLWFVLVLLIAVIVFAAFQDASGQEIPDAPKPQIFTKAFVVTEVIHWGGVIGDGWSSSSLINHSRCADESNPAFRNPNGTFKTGKYFAINGAIAGTVTVIHAIVNWKTHDKTARAVMGILVTGNGLYHWREVWRAQSFNC